MAKTKANRYAKRAGQQGVDQWGRPFTYNEKGMAPVLPLMSEDQAILDRFTPGVTTREEAQALHEEVKDRFHPSFDLLYRAAFRGLSPSILKNDGDPKPPPQPGEDYDPVPRQGDVATIRQLKYIKVLGRERDLDGLLPEVFDSWETAVIDLAWRDAVDKGLPFDQRPARKRPLFKREASELIDALMSQPKKAPATQPSGGIDLTPLFSGHFAVPDGDTRLKIKVQVKDDGHIWVNDGAAYGQRQLYGVQCNLDGCTDSWCVKFGRAGTHRYTGKIQAPLTQVLADPLEAARAYGKLTGACAVCNRTLEDEDSVARGIGPVCWGRLHEDDR